MKRLVLALALLAPAPADAMRYTDADRASTNIAFAAPINPGGPQFPADLLPCDDDEIPGDTCNCVGGDEDICIPVPWVSCGTDTDCEIKFRSPYGFKPRRD